MESKWNRFAPENKIFAVGLVAVLAWITDQFFGIEIPAEVAVGLAGVIGYFVPNREA